ncbi:MAG: S41 family peptidase [Cyclobacteriaceae bacterium]|nr:S41 family peptidase [Cyclobacteriaceae bacterium SS2]
MAGPEDGVFNLQKSLYKFRQVLSYLENDYVDEVNPDELVESAISEMLEKLDPHSVYIPAEELDLAKSQLEGNFEGIGIEFNIFKDTIYVVSALSGGPSEKIGLRSGDKIITVDGEDVTGEDLNNRRVINLLRGPKGSEVKVGILRKGYKELIDFTIVRDVIPQYSVDVSYMVDDEIGYIKVSRFSATTYMEFKEALVQLKSQGMKKMILDLTGNPGGYMDRAVDMVDEILKDQQMIVYTKGKESRYNSQHLSKNPGDFEEGAVVVMINEGSASASEIVSGALQDHDRAIIVGRRSFGKGLVQLPISLNDGSELRLTISRYYTPSGRSIQKPYGQNTEDYYSEYYDRFKNGEMYVKDSAKVVDSLVYKTDAGRNVYGGGGIMPDYFVPLDSSQSSLFLSRLSNTNTIREYALKYFEANKEKLERYSLEQYISDFKVTDKMMDDLLKLSIQNGVPKDERGFEKSRELIRVYTKAFIARSVWDNKGFYPIFNEQDEIFQKAVSLVDEAESLLKRRIGSSN